MCADGVDEPGYGVFGNVAGDVGFAYDADKPMVVDDGQPADLVFIHHAEHLFDAGLAADVIDATVRQLTGRGGIETVADGDALRGLA